jgi:hypothetical protein
MQPERRMVAIGTAPPLPCRVRDGLVLSVQVSAERDDHELTAIVAALEAHNEALALCRDPALADLRRAVLDGQRRRCVAALVERRWVRCWEEVMG